MKRENSRNGKIITFYSYKGGVGRTMSLANVAYLAAVNGKKVLVMDWDLEAPGLSYYFRGLVEPSQARELKDAPGIIDILYDWCKDLSEANTAGLADALVNDMEDGLPFKEAVRHLISPDLLPGEVVLDYIGAGARLIGREKLLSYEEALSKFSWGDFFEVKGGGLVLESLRNWAKDKYDLVLIDSRTGFADVAGICTMQLPDVVALCFVLNRQNIDGISRVAAAIRDARGEDVELRAVPMRVSRNESSEGSDAKARAIAELTKVGGFTSELIQDNIKNLAVNSYDDVPFYETISYFLASEPAFDPLTLNYSRLSSLLTGWNLDVPPLDEEVWALVRKRLVPRYATVEYLSNLSSAEPERALEEILALLDSAYDSVLNGEALDGAYVRALLDAISVISEMRPIDSIEIKYRGLDLIRVLSQVDGPEWRAILISKIQEIVDYPAFSEDDEILTLLEELDGLLASNGQLLNKIKRVGYRRTAARMFVDIGELESASQTLGECLALRKEILNTNPRLTSGQVLELEEALIHSFLIRGDIELARDMPKKAYEEYAKGLKTLQENTAWEMSDGMVSLKSGFHFKLMTAPSEFISDVEASNHALDATIVAPMHQVAIRFVQLAKAILRARDPFICLRFCELVTLSSDAKSRTYLVNYNARTPMHTKSFIEAINGVCALALQTQVLERLSHIFRVFSDIIQSLLKYLERRRQTVGERQRDSLLSELKVTQEIFDIAGVALDVSTDIRAGRIFSKPSGGAPVGGGYE